MTDRSLDELADAFVVASRALVGIAVRSVDAAPVDITVTQHRVLVLLASRGGLTISEIAAELAVNRSNASRHCDRLQRLGLVARRRSEEDGRVVCVVLTPEGSTVVDAVTRARRAEILAVLERMDDVDPRAIIGALQAFNDAAHETSDLARVTA